MQQSPYSPTSRIQNEEASPPSLSPCLRAPSCDTCPSVLQRRRREQVWHILMAHGGTLLSLPKTKAETALPPERNQHGGQSLQGLPHGDPQEPLSNAAARAGGRGVRLRCRWSKDVKQKELSPRDWLYIVVSRGSKYIKSPTYKRVLFWENGSQIR